MTPNCNPTLNLSLIILAPATHIIKAIPLYHILNSNTEIETQGDINKQIGLFAKILKR